MGNWKELGEVPDSDDEGLDSQELPDENDPPTATQLAQPDPTDDHDIWSIPTSSQERVGLYRSTNSLQNATVREALDTGPGRPRSWDSDGSLSDPPSSPIIRSFSGPADDQDPPVIGGVTPVSGPRTSTLEILLSHHDATRADLPPTGGPYQRERSFRPRKPIQEHPYLLESVQYAQVMKSHGIKPVKVAAPPEEGHSGVEEEDSQGREFTLGHSQTETLETADDRFLSKLASDILGDGGVGNTSCSPSPRTSPPRRPAEHTSPPSSGEDGGHGTDFTSLSSDDDLPPIDALVRRGLPKRKILPTTYRKPKRPKPRAIMGHMGTSDIASATPPDILNLPSSPHPSLPVQQRVLRRGSPRIEISTINQLASQDDVEAATGGDAMSDSWDRISGADQEGNSNGDSDSDASIVRKNRKRIRGVLPASWLRLDQQKARKPDNPRTEQRSLSPTAGPLLRRGLAIARRQHGGANPGPLLSLYEDSDDGDDVNNGSGMSHAFDEVLPDSPQRTRRTNMDDGGSVVEEDDVDRMLLGKKRRRTSIPTTPRKKTRKNRPSTFRGLVGKHSRQSRIDKSLVGDRRSYAPRRPRAAVAAVSRTSLPTSTNPNPPVLGILDVLQQGAPDFIRIAARTAKSRRCLGRSDPLQKVINLGNRPDNIDALSVLSDWKMGKIRPKAHTRLPHSMPQEKRKPLQLLSTNTSREHHRSALKSTSEHQQVLKKQIGLEAFLSPDNRRRTEAAQTPKSRPRQRLIRGTTRTLSRPAQLESIKPAAGAPGRPGFVAGKRMLDAVYRRKEKELPALPPTSAEQIVAAHVSSPRRSPSTTYTALGSGQTVLPQARLPQQRKRRKVLMPRCVDTTAARFAHADDPLPIHPLFRVPDREPTEELNNDRLRGLGPFGTQYTVHFEVFPLDTGVFFHETTLIGNRRLRKATDSMFAHKLRQRAPKFISFQLGERNVSWGPWNDSISSELGILLDWIAEQLEGSEPLTPALRSATVKAADSLLEYVQDFLSFDEDAARSSFIARCVETLSAFLTRVDDKTKPSDYSQHATDLRARGYLDVILRLFLVSYCAWRVAPDGDSSAGGLMQRFAKRCVKYLLILGFDEVRGVYDDLQRLSNRERGIRVDKQTLVAWVCIMKVMEHAQLPKAGFWDLTYSVMLPADLDKASDVAVFEEVWRSMFTLLPLSEFDEDGVLLAQDSGRVSSFQGWDLPQRTLKRVFGLYNKNPRQSPGFNGYCRALLGRCHYLVQQWGWGRCTGILGTLFDFFGSHQLAHLRNEEVYKSPDFLEDLNAVPRAQLSVEAGDRCFHVFLKMLALVLFRLRHLGHTKEIRNLVARTLPNHDRQYLKEHTVRQHDLAALRNHHDLLCTLFWAAPPAARPSVHSIEKLVNPASSHKEACLINLRAWRQLARFVAASGEANTVHREFRSWQTNVFQQVLSQYQSAAADVQQQAAALSKDKGHSFSGDMVDDVVAKNQAAAMDILHACVVGSLEVLKCAQSLQAASSCLNTSQLAQVFTKLDLSASNVDWSTILGAVQVVDEYMDRLEKALDRQYSSDQSSGDDSHIEEAVLMLDHRIAGGLLSMARRLSSSPPAGHRARDHGRASCTEKAIVLSARLASRLIHAGVAGLSRFFQRESPYFLFEGLPHRMSLAQRKYLPLFVTTLLKNNVFDFKDIGATTLHLWMLAIVKPSQALGYENYLAETLKQHGMPYLERTFVAVGSTPDYACNRDFFVSAMASMRRSLREADANQRRPLRADFQDTLAAVMQQMKADLEQTQETPADGRFVEFVRDIISAIKSFGAGIATIDPFYYQMGPYYSPSREDPQLQTAGIVSYGIRAGEGDAQAVPQLFHYLCNNLKMAVAHGRLDEEGRILEKAMENNDVLSFMLGRMFPAVVEAVGLANEAWPWLSVYSGALTALLTRSSLPREIDEANMADVVGLVEGILSGLNQVGTRAGASEGVSCTELYILVQLTGLANVLQPTLASYSWLAEPPASTSRLQRAVSAYADFSRDAARHLADVLDNPDPEAHVLRAEDVTRAATAAAADAASVPRCYKADAGRFAQAIVDDVMQSWVVQQNRAAVRVGVVGGGKVGQGSASPQSGGGISFERWERGHLAKRLHHQVRLWHLKPTRPTRLWPGQRALPELADVVV